MSVKLVVISGPNRGATYFLVDGESTLGRSPENQVVLASTQVSKVHCTFVYQNKKLELSDKGSSNGTFVNGVLTKRKLLKDHDRISVGPFVLEVLLPSATLPQVVSPSSMPEFSGAAVAVPEIDAGHFKIEEPTSLIGRLHKKFDEIFLPVLFDFYERMDYSTLFTIMFAVYTFLNLGFTVYPVLQRSREEVIRQAEQQAIYISKQVAYLNRQAVLEGKETALMIDFAQAEPNVKEVVIATIEGRVMAPGDRLNEVYTNPVFLKYKDRLQKRQDIWGQSQKMRLADEEEILAFTPVMVMSKTKGFNVPGAIAAVVYSTATISLDPGTVGTIYFEALVWSCLLGFVFLYLLHQVTHKPLHKLNEDMDKALKGELDSVEKKYKNEAIDQLIDRINSALGRIPRSDAAAQTDAQAGDQEQLIVDNMMRIIESISMKMKHAMLMLDLEMRIKLLNSGFEELTGIRDAQGEVIDTVSRDESFPALIKELAEKSVSAGNEGIEEEYDFSSGTHKIRVTALSGVPGKVEGYLFLFEKTGD